LRGKFSSHTAGVEQKLLPGLREQNKDAYDPEKTARVAERPRRPAGRKKIPFSRNPEVVQENRKTQRARHIYVHIGQNIRTGAEISRHIPVAALPAERGDDWPALGFLAEEPRKLSSVDGKNR
jgi:hypothetical protein